VSRRQAVGKRNHSSLNRHFVEGPRESALMASAYAEKQISPSQTNKNA
jgi:hypothetical protein